MKRNFQMNKIILSVAITGFVMGGLRLSPNPSAPPAPQSMHQPAPAVDASQAAKKTVTALGDL